MATPTPTESKPSAVKSFFFDPFKIWRQAFEVSEQLLTSAIERTLNTTQFAEANGKLMELILLSMKTARGNVKTLLHTLNFPSREDSARLGQLILALEEKVDQVHDRLDQLEATLRAVRAELAAEKAAARVEK
jgi:polyhydroxyalkanoic acid synthase PhaR subunit